MGSYLIIVLEDQPQRVIFGEIVPGPVDEDNQLVADTKKKRYESLAALSFNV